jgi:hypothetical protein
MVFNTRMLLFLCLCTACAVGPALSPAAASPERPAASGGDAGVLAPSAAPWSTVDHSKHEALQQDFDSGPEVTEACLSCHNQAAKQVQQTIHWTWICPADPKGVMGKNGLTLNNF